MNFNDIEWVEVNSSNVFKIAYDEENCYLYIYYTNNTLYRYHGVPLGEFQGLKVAPSIGAYLHRNIKNLYTYERLE